MKKRYQFAVIGDPIKHSLSPVIHKQFAKQNRLIVDYEKIQIPLTQLDRFFEQDLTKFDGINITAPHKEQAYHTLIKKGFVADSKITTIECTNTIDVIQKKLYNTDGPGLIRHLSQCYGSLKNKRILILGAGGATLGVLPSILKETPLEICVWNRTAVKAQKIATRHPKITTDLNGFFNLIINATTRKNWDQPPPFFEHVSRETFLYDLTYARHEQTPFLKEALKTKSLKHSDGLGMLIYQAARSFQIWTQTTPDPQACLFNLRPLLRCFT